MVEKIKATDKVGCTVERARGVKEDLQLKGTYRWEHIRNGEVIGRYENHNVVTSEGLQHLLSSAIDNDTRYTAWYVALVSATGPPPVPSAAHVYDTFLDTSTLPCTEFTSYSNATRPAYNGVVSANKITNTASKAAFTVSAGPSPDTVHAAALVSVNTKSDHGTGVLMSWSDLAGGTITVLEGDVLNIEIELAFS